MKLWENLKSFTKSCFSNINNETEIRKDGYQKTQKSTELPDFQNMTKRQLENYGRKHLNIELDRRHSKAKLIARLESVSDRVSSSVSASVAANV